MTAYAHNSNVLTGGRWVNVRGIQRWVPNPVLPEPANPADAIACPTCGAKASETCRTETGQLIGPHATRELPRCCPCGGSLPTNRAVYCATCRAERVASRYVARQERKAS